MFESSVTSPTYIFASLSKDTSLFLFFNLMILSILVSSILNFHRDQHDRHNQQDLLYPQNLQRAPSILQRLISLNFYNNLKLHEEHHYHHYPQSLYTNDVHEPQHNDDNPNQFVRSSSILETLMSMNLFNFKTHFPFSNTNQPNTNYNNFEQSNYNFDQTQEVGQSYIMEDEHEEEAVGDEPTLDEIYSRIKNQNNNYFPRKNPNPKPQERPSFNSELPVKRLRKTTSMRVSCSPSQREDRDSIENRRPATMRERSRMRMSDVDEEINEKATDFINSFKQQLRLQRIESIKKYEDMIARGSAEVDVENMTISEYITSLDQ